MLEKITLRFVLMFLVSNKPLNVIRRLAEIGLFYGVCCYHDLKYIFADREGKKRLNEESRNMAIIIVGVVIFMIIKIFVDAWNKKSLNEVPTDMPPTKKKPFYSRYLVPSRQREYFIGDLLEMQECMREEGNSEFSIYLYTIKTVSHNTFSNLMLKLKEQLGLSPKSKSETR